MKQKDNSKGENEAKQERNGRNATETAQDRAESHETDSDDNSPTNSDKPRHNAFEAYLDKYADFLVTGDWHIELNGVWREKEIKNKRGETVDTRFERASPIPIIPTAILTNVDSRIEKVEISFYKFGRWKKVIVPRSLIASKNTIIKLADDGIEVDGDSAGLLMRYLSEVIADSLDFIPRFNAKSCLGWSEVGFLPYADGIVFDGDKSYQTLYDSVRSKGNLQDWVSYMQPLRHNKEFRLTMAAAFASPLLELIGENCFILHLWGGTGSGKTVALMSAMSVWGDPANGKLVRTMNMTQNAMLSTASFLRNLPFAGDELQTIKQTIGNYDTLIMKITEGIDRARMSRTELMETKSWKCSFLFTGEEPIIKPESGGGAKNRVIEVECKRKLVENGNAIANFVRLNYGTAGKAYIERLEQMDRAEIISMYRTYFDSILQDCNTTDKQSGAMAIMLVSDLIASSLFWKDETPLTPSDVKEYLFTESEVDVSERAYQFTMSAIAENASKFEDSSIITWGIIETGIVYFNKSVLNKLLQSEGYSLKAVARKWAESGYIMETAQNGFRTVKKIRGICVAVMSFKMNIDDSGRAMSNQNRVGQYRTAQDQSSNYSELFTPTTISGVQQTINSTGMVEINADDELPF